MQEFHHICTSNFSLRLRQLYYQFLMPKRIDISISHIFNGIVRFFRVPRTHDIVSSATIPQAFDQSRLHEGFKNNAYPALVGMNSFCDILYRGAM